MQFVETSKFTQQIGDLLPDQRYRALQSELIARPTAGAVIRGTGGARKIRWTTRGGGKSGGIRVIYYYSEDDATCYMLFAFSKTEKASLTDAQKVRFKDYITRYLK